MKITYIHYHLKTGGVTTVLKQQVEAVKKDVELLVLTGEPSRDPFPAEVVCLPGLGYDHSYPEPLRPDEIASAVVSAIAAKWKDGCDLVHVHNPTLAKNNFFLKILKELQKKGLTLFLQIHDFAEDGRPQSYFQEDYLSDCHYGVINSRDYRILRRAGLTEAGLHRISNMINPLHLKSANCVSPRYILYPVRALRRKNIGEAILLSLFFKHPEPLAITQPPNSPIDLLSYRHWKEFAQEKKLNVHFEAALNSEFETLVLSTKFFITTSITEGFGFSFLEPWASGKLLWGRKLSYICDDFEKNNIHLQHLYDHLQIPIEWIGKEKLLSKFKAAILKNCRLFNFTLDEEKILTTFYDMTLSGTIDFGLLDEAFQKIIITRLLADHQNLNRLIQLNPFLSNPADLVDKDALIANNRNAILTHYSQAKYRQNLLDLYESVIHTPVRQSIDRQRLLSEFFDLNAFSLLKWGDYAE
jgi:glycosyltransferase involved in cell wall biosynthesis